MKQLLDLQLFRKFEAFFFKLEHLVDRPGVAAKLRQWLSVKQLKDHYTLFGFTVLLVFYDNFIGSFLFFLATQALRAWLSLLVKLNTRGFHQT